MILVSRVVSRFAATLFAGSPASYYVFFSAIEIGTTAFIFWYAWRWRAADDHQD